MIHFLLNVLNTSCCILKIRKKEKNNNESKMENKKKYIKIPKLFFAILLIVVFLIIIGLVIGLIVLGIKNSELNKTNEATTIGTTSLQSKTTNTPATTSTKDIVTTTNKPVTTSTKEIVTTTKISSKCKNYGKWVGDKCDCLISTYGDYCENEVECSKLKDDPIECNLITNVESDDLDYLKVYCPIKFRCS